MKKILFLIGVFACLAGSSMAQSEKKIKANKIQKRVVTETVHESGVKENYTLEEKVFDNEGRVVELKEYKEDKLDKWVKYTYTTDGEIESESTLSRKGKVTKKEVYTYKNGLKSTKEYFDGKGRLLKVRTYTYSNF